METIKQKLNLIHLYSRHKVDPVGFLLSLLSQPGCWDHYGKLITGRGDESDPSPGRARRPTRGLTAAGRRRGAAVGGRGQARERGATGVGTVAGWGPASQLEGVETAQGRRTCHSPHTHAGQSKRKVPGTSGARAWVWGEFARYSLGSPKVVGGARKDGLQPSARPQPPHLHIGVPPRGSA